MNWNINELKLTSVSNCRLMWRGEWVDFDCLYDDHVVVTSSMDAIQDEVFPSRYGGARELWNMYKSFGFIHINPRIDGRPSESVQMPHRVNHDRQ